MKFYNWFKIHLFKAMLLLFLILMLVFSEASYRGASSGLLLWFHNVLPNLLPFIIVSNLIVRLNVSKQISKAFYPLLGRLFGISNEGCYPIIIGFLSGIPMGAKTSADLVLERRISLTEAQFLFTMCNNASPMFIIGYISLTQLKLPQMKAILFVIIYGSAILGALSYRFFRKVITKSTHPDRNQSLIIASAAPVSNRFSFNMIDNSIMNGFEIVTKIGGYIILFSILAQIMKEALPGAGIMKATIMGILEITTGISQICSTDISENVKIVLVTLITSFGGISGMAQTKSVLQDSGLSIKAYLIVKLISAVFALVMALIYITYFS